MSAEKMREEFAVAFFKENTYYPCREDYGDGYSSPFTNGAWWAWQASRAAIEVELPTSLQYTGSGSAIDACRDAIESLGLKVKP